MKIVFVSNILTPHQVPICDEWFSMRDLEFNFIESIDVDKSTLPVGWRFESMRPYLTSFEKLSVDRQYYEREILNADAVIFGSGDYSLIKERLASNKLTFIYSERIYKNWREWVKYPYHRIKFRKKYGWSNALYLLCASAFSSVDYNRLGLFRNKTFKWGYFPRTEVTDESLMQKEAGKESVRILWCARFIPWKHPELAIMLAKRLKNEGYNFCLDMIGTGKLFDEINEMIEENGLSDCVHLLGELSNKEVYRQMRQHDIFLFTSDQNEGWGAVANEAMSNGCLLVGSDKIGSVPFLVKDGVNGMIFKSGSVKSLFEKIKILLDDAEMRRTMACKGIDTITTLWNPRSAAKALVVLIDELQNNKQHTIVEGPCSRG